MPKSSISEARNTMLTNNIRELDLLNLSDIWLAMCHSWRLIFGVTLLFALSTFLLTLVLSKQWEATAMLRIGHIPSSTGELKLIEDPLQTVERIKLIGFKEKVLTDLHLPTDKGSDDRTDLLLKSLQGNVISNTEFINLSIRGYSAIEAKNSLKAIVKEIKATHTSIIQPAKSRAIKESQLITERLTATSLVLASLKKNMLAAGTYNASSAFAPSVIAINLLTSQESDVRTLQNQQIQYDTQIAAFDEQATSLVNTIYVSKKPAFPKQNIFLIVGTLLGLLVGTWIAILKYKKV